MVSEERQTAGEKLLSSIKKVAGEAGKLSRVEKVASRVGKLATKKQPSETYKFGRQVSPHLMAAVTGTKVQKSSKKGSRGRGRPSGTYKVRYLPSGRAVKVPTHIYKKMLSAEKSQIRLAQAQQMAQAQMQADQVAMQQDPRFQQSAEDQFLAEPDQQHEMDVMRAKQEMELEQQMQQYPQQRPEVGRKIVKGFGDFGRGLNNLGRARPQQQQMVDEYGRPLMQQSSIPQPRGMGIKGEPSVTAISKRASLLNVPNEFNNPGQSSILWNKRRRYI